MKVDLDALDQLGYVFEGEQRTLVWDAVAELRAARELLTFYDPPHCSQNCTCAKATAWRAYKAVGGGV